MSPLSFEARRLFELARGQDEPDVQARNRVASALAMKIAAGATLTAAGASAATLSAVLVKSALVLGVTGALAAGGWLTWKTLQPHQETVASPREEAPIAKVAPVIHEEATAWEPPAADAPSKPGKIPVYRKTTRASAQSDPLPRAPVVAIEDGLRAETEALRSAQEALREKQPEQALRLLDEQDRRFRLGLLPQERSAARVLALCQAGRVDEARAQAGRFEGQWPRSPLLVRVRSACWAH